MQTIPRATAEKLATDFPKGTRHQAKIDIALSLLGSGLSPTAVIIQLCEKFPEASHREIESVVSWCASRHPAPPSGQTNGMRWNPARTNGHSEKPKRTPLEQCEWWTSGSRMTAEEIVASSPIPVPSDGAESGALAISSLYADSDLLNIVCKFTVSKDGKANPSGGGKTLRRDQWVIWFRDRGVPQLDAGAWFRINPCTQTGTGAGGAVRDQDITKFNYALLEADHIPVAVQLALFHRLKLPIAAIVLSGANSAHAWVRVNQPNAESYDATVRRMLEVLEPFGIDKANRNESRLSRLPGAVRIIKAVNGGNQKLLFLNPDVASVTDELLARFEESLLVPAIEDKPMRSLARAALSRYKEMQSNVGKLGVPTGIPELDRISGGMKPGQTIVVAGKTGGGKTTLALHMIDAALTRNYGVILFSLEMDREEVFDLIVSNRCSINRNKFNNGEFHHDDLEAVAARVKELEDMPLYIDDSPMTSADQIRLQVLQLKASKKVHLAVVDYIQFVNPEWSKDVREQQVATISHKLRALARETRLPFVILSQLNDEGKLRESRVISHNANIVLKVDVEGDHMKVSVDKGRGIPSGDYGLTFNRVFARLEQDRPDSDND